MVKGFCGLQKSMLSESSLLPAPRRFPPDFSHSSYSKEIQGNLMNCTARQFSRKNGIVIICDNSLPETKRFFPFHYSDTDLTVFAATNTDILFHKFFLSILSNSMFIRPISKYCGLCPCFALRYGVYSCYAKIPKEHGGIFSQWHEPFFPEHRAIPHC